MNPWIKKYAPETLNDIIGQNRQISEIKSFVESFIHKKNKKKALLLYGASGTGKTSSVYALSNELDLEILEINASDFRKKENINDIIGNSIKQRSLFNRQKVILVDELDGISGKKDFGGASALAKLIDVSTVPIIITANDPYNDKLKELRKKSELIEFNILNYSEIFLILRKIADKENIKTDDITLKSLARMAGGDMRAGINDFQTLASAKKEISREDLEMLAQRDKTESMQNALLKIFKTKKLDIALSAFNNVDEDFDKRILWLDENIPLEYTKPNDLKNAYEWLSRSDIYARRIRRRQYWRLLVYINAFLSGGIALSKEEKYPQTNKYNQTKRILKIWMANMKQSKKKEIALKLAKATHTSKKNAYKHIPFIKNIFENNKTMSDKISKNLELTSDEISWLKK